MFSYNQIKNKLHKSTAAVLAETAVFDDLSAAAKRLISDFLAVSLTEPYVENLAEPFTFIIEYLAAARIPALTEDFTNRINKNFDLAFTILERRKQASATSAPASGEINFLYNLGL